jgi:dihydroneopterin aldolase
MSGGDRIVLRGLRGHGRHGVLASEREAGQEFVVDVALDLDLRDAGRSDDLRDTVHYGELAERVVAIVEGEPVALIEALATRIADHCLGLARVERVEVTVHKPEAPIDVAFEDVAVTVVRTP